MEEFTAGVHVYSCGLGHAICQPCKELLPVREDEQNPDCPECRSPIIGRNVAFERILERMRIS